MYKYVFEYEYSCEVSDAYAFNYLCFFISFRLSNPL